MKLLSLTLNQSHLALFTNWELISHPETNEMRHLPRSAALAISTLDESLRSFHITTKQTNLFLFTWPTKEEIFRMYGLCRSRRYFLIYKSYKNSESSVKLQEKSIQIFYRLTVFRISRYVTVWASCDWPHDVVFVSADTAFIADWVITAHSSGEPR